jgi:hypothetical protein
MLLVVFKIYKEVMMTKNFASEQLNSEVVEAIIRLAASTPLSSIRLEDISRFINEKYKLEKDKRYLTGSISAALERSIKASLRKMDNVVAEQIKELEKYLKRGSARNKAKNKHVNLGRWRRTLIWITFLAHEYVWHELSAINSIFQLKMPEGLRFKVLCEQFLNFGFPQEDVDKEKFEGMREIFIVECTMPIGVRKEFKDGMRWVEPLNPFFLKFIKSFDSYLEELQERGIFDPNLSSQAIRQIILGAMIYQALGKILQERNNPLDSQNPGFFTANYSSEQALAVLKKICLSFCASADARETFDQQWS